MTSKIPRRPQTHRPRQHEEHEVPTARVLIRISPRLATAYRPTHVAVRIASRRFGDRRRFRRVRRGMTMSRPVHAVHADQAVQTVQAIQAVRIGRRVRPSHKPPKRGGVRNIVSHTRTAPLRFPSVSVQRSGDDADPVPPPSASRVRYSRKTRQTESARQRSRQTCQLSHEHGHVPRLVLCRSTCALACEALKLSSEFLFSARN